MRYIEALVRLWMRQAQSEGNTAAHPREGPVSTIIDTVKRSKAIHDRQNHTDKLVGSYVDGLTSPELIAQMADHGFQRNNPEGLRDRSMILLSHYGMLRSGNLCNLELSDCFASEVMAEGPTTCHALFFVMTNGKTNQDARLEERCVFRAKDVEVCAWSAMALLDFERFHSGRYGFGPQAQAYPDLSTSGSWFQLKVYPSPKGLEAPLPYETHYKTMDRMISDLNIQTSKVTHLGRGTGAKAAQILGASSWEIDKAGGWQAAKTARGRSYALSVSLEAARTLAGFKSKGAFFLQRAIPPPEEALKLFFPWIEDSEQQLAQGLIQKSMTVEMWLKRMKLQRMVLCQDLPLLIKRVPSFYLWQHEIFSTPQWQRWQTRFHDAYLVHSNPIQTTLLNLAPELMATMGARFDHIEQSQKQMLTAMEAATKASQLHSQMMVDIITGRLTPQISWCWTADPGPSANSLPVTSLPFMAESLKDLQPANQSANNHQSHQGSSSVSNLPPMPAPQPGRSVSQSSPPRKTTNVVSDPAAQLLQLMQGSKSNPVTTTASAKLQCHMSKTLTLVSDAWREYSQGIGGSALKALYESPDWSWAGRDSERRYWRRREPLIRAVERFAAAHGQSAVVVAAHMDEKLRGKGISLYQLAEQCKKGTYSYEP